MAHSTENMLTNKINKTEEQLNLVAAGFSPADHDLLDSLQNSGYVVEEHPGLEGLKEYILSSLPHILLLDLDGLDQKTIEIVRNLKENPMTYTKPIIIVIGKRDIKSEIEVLEAGAEDFLEKPFPHELLAARICTCIRRNTRLQISNPLTGLPGALYIEELTTKRLQKKQPVAMCYTDLNDFKAFNDKYGYRRGDNVIRILATILNEAVSMFGKQGDFVGHIGGDDFVMIVDYACIHPVCEYVTKSFDTLIPYQYDEKDRERGDIISINRQGQEMHFPLMTVSIGIVTNEKRTISNYLILTELAAEMKEFAKDISKNTTPPQSIFKIDKRIQ